MTTFTTERGERTRARIVDRARELFATRGYRGTSMTDILAATGLTKGGFYFHFASKADLGQAVLDETNGMIDARILGQAGRGRAIDDLEAVARGAFAVCLDPALVASRRLTDELCASCEDGPREIHGVRWAQIVEELVVRAQREGDVDPGVDARASSVLIVSAYFGLMDLLPALGASPDAFLPAYLDMAFGVLGLRRGDTR